MTEAGIHDGDIILIRCENVPRDNAIQVVQYDGKSTLKLLKQNEGNGWELHYRDGTGQIINCQSNDYKTQGEFEAVLPKTIVSKK
jgi:SOS-response transcriptional repressor LexA